MNMEQWLHVADYVILWPCALAIVFWFTLYEAVYVFSKFLCVLIILPVFSRITNQEIGMIFYGITEFTERNVFIVML